MFLFQFAVDPPAPDFALGFEFQIFLPQRPTKWKKSLENILHTSLRCFLNVKFLSVLFFSIFCSEFSSKHTTLTLSMEKSEKNDQ